MRRHDNKIGVDCVRFHDQHRLDTIVAWLDMLDLNTPVEQKNLDLLGAIGKYQNVMFECSPAVPSSTDPVR